MCRNSLVSYLDNTMAQNSHVVQEFIKDAFTPQIALLCSPQAEKICLKNNLSCTELLQPFAKLSRDLYYKDIGGVVITVKNLGVSFVDVNSKPPQTVIAKTYLNSSVSNASVPKSTSLTVGDKVIDVPNSTPWYDSWKNTFLKVQYPSDHEFTKHFLGCVLVVSSTDSKPADTMVTMTQNFSHILNDSQGSLPKWFNVHNVLKYHVILHDNVQGNTDIASEAYEALKVTFGPLNVFLLKINSRQPNRVDNENLPDPWSQYLQTNINPCQTTSAEKHPPSFPASTTVELGQEASESKSNTVFHPLSSSVEELSAVEDNFKSVKEAKELLPQKHGLCLTSEDLEQIRLFVFEFCKSCLIPYIEKQIQQLNDNVFNKKGVSRSIFSATKRWFNPNKPGASAIASSHLMYAPDAPEIQLRKLGDLYFMFSHYSSAFQAYHNAKRDFNSDQAWLYYAGALEMACLAAYMANEASRKTFDYIEQSILIYLTTCKLPQFATRATILGSECLKSNGLYGDAARQLIRMTSEDSDLRSALLLEQAAYCFLKSKMLRKYSFHMVLSGHRFSKAAQRKHSLRCYKQAHQVYMNSNWNLAEDHIYYTLGRLSNNLQLLNDAVKSFAKLFRYESKQSADQQKVFLKEFMTILDTKQKSVNQTGKSEIPTLPVPEFDSDQMKILISPPSPLTTPGKFPAKGVNFNDDIHSEKERRFHKLEEILIQEAKGSLPVTYKPTINLYTRNEVLKFPIIAIYQEPIQILIKIINILEIPLNLKKVHLIWSFGFVAEKTPINFNHPEGEDYVKTHVVNTVIIPENSQQNLTLALTPLTAGFIKIAGIAFALIGSNSESNTFIEGKQLFGEKHKYFENGSANTLEKHLECVDIEVGPPAPCLQVSFTEVPDELLCDEIQRVTVYLENTGLVALTNVYMATSVPDLVSSWEFGVDWVREDFEEEDSPVLREKLGRKSHVTHIELPRNRLLPGESHSVNVWIKAPEKQQTIVIDLLFYYESFFKGAIPSHRLIRHFWNLTIHDSLETKLFARASHKSKLIEEISLPITISNLNKPHYPYSTEFTILSVRLMSKYWILMKESITFEPLKLNSQESVHIFLKAKRITGEKSVLVSINLDSSTREKHLENAYIAFAKKFDVPQINLFKERDTSEKAARENFENEQGTLFLQWNGIITHMEKKRLIYGQTQMPFQIMRGKEISSEENEDTYLNIDFSNLLNDTIRKKKEEKQQLAYENQVVYNFLHPTFVQHDFEMEKLCVVPITLYIRSILEGHILKCKIATMETSSVTRLCDSNIICPEAMNSFRWLKLGRTHLEIRPLTTEIVQLSALFTDPGTYDLGAHLQISCARDEPNKFVNQVCQIQAIIIVADCKK